MQLFAEFARLGPKATTTDIDKLLLLGLNKYGKGRHNKSLGNLLSLPEVRQFILETHWSESEFMFDLCDGRYIRSSPLFTRNTQALHIILNTDDLEVVNPLGSHVKKHKISIFYFTLGNIPPQYRSRLSAIQLVAIAKTAHLRSNNEDSLGKLLANFIDVVNAMATGGVTMKVNGQEPNIEGTLVIAPCDTPAANWRGQFKEGVGFAFKACRSCNCKSEEMKRMFDVENFVMRDIAIHKERCKALECDLGPQERKHFSNIWGINGIICLLNIENFPLSQGLVQDPMHVFLEGIVKNEVELCLFHLIFSKRYFDIHRLNSLLSGFEFDYSYLHQGRKP